MSAWWFYPNGKNLTLKSQIHEGSGWPFQAPTENDRESAIAAAAGKPQWPLLGSVFIEGDIGIVVMPQVEKTFE
jgi:hypothetical protein